eukprot:TRINITY_DN30450_c0_g2_i2.p2 TRINITY_DN30450_c0_g2~~TRINITY_DN30450_c0_g2_i2.p2  ORF type:complete len:107 (+),score=16.90 TRINITY_DN30450_c0_g2_i2:552-872(+)
MEAVMAYVVGLRLETWLALKQRLANPPERRENESAFMLTSIMSKGARHSDSYADSDAEDDDDADDEWFEMGLARLPNSTVPLRCMPADFLLSSVNFTDGDEPQKEN